EAAPGWMQAVARMNPLTYLVDADRALFNGTLGDPSVWQGGVAAVVVAALGLTVGIRAMRHSTDAACPMIPPGVSLPDDPGPPHRHAHHPVPDRRRRRCRRRDERRRPCPPAVRGRRDRRPRPRRAR